jgi:uncharacterized protein DUF4252
MKRVFAVSLLTVLVVPGVARAQDVSVPRNIERLAEKATQSVNVTVDGALLQLAAKFLSADDPDQKTAKELIAGLKGIYVRNFEFADSGAYTDADVESLRAQVKGPGWSRMVGVRSVKDGEDVDVYFRMEKDKIAGVVVIAAQARQLTFVNIVGQIDLERLAQLGGHMSIPKIRAAGKE